MKENRLTEEKLTLTREDDRYLNVKNILNALSDAISKNKNDRNIAVTVDGTCPITAISIYTRCVDGDSDVVEFNFITKDC